MYPMLRLKGILEKATISISNDAIVISALINPGNSVRGGAILLIRLLVITVDVIFACLIVFFPTDYGRTVR